MEDKKLFGRTCPKCGSLYKECQFTPVSLGSGVQANMQCENNHKWSEFYQLDYQGYWWDGKKYDTYGDEVKKETET